MISQFSTKLITKNIFTSELLTSMMRNIKNGKIVVTTEEENQYELHISDRFSANQPQTV